MLENNFAEHFAADWIDSWNSNDLGRILSHYTDDFEMTSPVIITAYPLATRARCKVESNARLIAKHPRITFEPDFKGTPWTNHGLIP